MYPVSSSARLTLAAALAGLGLVTCVGDVSDDSVDTRPFIDTTGIPDTAPPVRYDTSSTGDTATPRDTTTSADTTNPNDTSSGCTGFGCACRSNSDCLEELCIEGADGYLCTQRCLTECPDGYDCRLTSGFGPDPLSVCVPRHTRLCRPCRTDTDCRAPGDAPGLCLTGDDPAQGSFCGSDCQDGTCPTGYSCRDITRGGDIVNRQCVPSVGQCVCRPSWAGAGYETACAVSNAAGSCSGTRTCSTTGLTDCDADTPLAETCNGADDNCDGQIDNISANSCDISNSFGTCTGSLSCRDGAQVCVGSTPKAEVCNGADDDCNGHTDEDSCNDNLSCTVDICQPQSGCSNTLNPNTCLIDGVCRAPNEAKPGDSCFACIPAEATRGWSLRANASCDDGNACTQNDVCTANGCKGTAYSCDDGLACTVDSCNGNGTCSHTPAASTCTIGGQCVASGTTNPSNECEVCNPAQNNAGWSAKPNGASCNDGNSCSKSDTCQSGTCAGTAYTCNDGKTCTSDSCDGNGGCTFDITSGCVINNACVAANAFNPSNPCQQCLPNVSKTAWSPNTGNSCNDGNACSHTDKCSAGVCLGTAYSCNDSLSCTSDVCNGTGGCANPVIAGNCLIDSTCYANNAAQPGNVCRKCNAAQNQLNWTDNNGVSCSDSDSCTGSDTCAAGTCTGSPIRDGSEVNDAITTARALNPYTICDNGDRSTPTGSITATLYPSGDVDWFKFRIDDDCSNKQPSPWVRLKNIPVGQDYDLCIYYECDDFGKGDKGSCESSGGTAATTVLNGQTLKGCCSRNGSNNAEFAYYYPECDNGGIWADDDTGTTYVHITRWSGAPVCEAYTLEYGDD